MLRSLLLFFSIAKTTNSTLQLQETADTHIVVCNSTMPCSGDLVTDCVETDKHCIIDCTNGQMEAVCKDAEFICNPNYDCTLICDSSNSTMACWGAILRSNASNSNAINENKPITNVEVKCFNSRSCEYMIIDTNNAQNIHLNITMNDVTNSNYAQYIAKHTQIYLPLTGSVSINCIGHSSCHTLQIYANDSQISQLNVVSNGVHSFKDSYLSFPSNANINILCNNSQSCMNAKFDGFNAGMNSSINVQCFGKNACFDTYIISHKLTKSLIINGILSHAHIFCPLHSNSVCTVIATDALSNTEIYSNDNIIIESSDAYTQNESALPILHCYDSESGDSRNANESCDIMFESETNEWICYDKNESISCLPNLFSFESTVVSYFDDDNLYNEIKTGLMHNTKGQIVLTTIVCVLVLLCIAVGFAKKEGIKEWLRNPFHTNGNQSNSINHDLFAVRGMVDKAVMRIPDYSSNDNGIKIGKFEFGQNRNKNKYESLEESVSCSMNDESVILSDDTDYESQSN